VPFPAPLSASPRLAGCYQHVTITSQAPAITSPLATHPARTTNPAATMPALRPRLRLPRSQIRAFTSHQHPSSPVYTPLESAVLSTALSHVPEHGFTSTSLYLSLRAHNLRTISSSALFPRGAAFSIILFHLYQQRVSLNSRVAFPPSTQDTTQKLRTLLKTRLQGNIDAGVAERWGEALATMSLAENIPASIGELAKLADEVVTLAGDRSVDTTWYAKRAAVTGVYAATGRF
jgi:ubiquinone biosynthesis protein COQ9